MIQSCQNLMGLEPLVARPLSLQDHSSRTANGATDPLLSQLTATADQTHSFTAYLQTLEAKFREETAKQAETVQAPKAGQSEEGPVKPTQQETALSDTEEQSRVNQEKETQADKRAAVKDKSAHEGLHTAQSLLHDEKKKSALSATQADVTGSGKEALSTEQAAQRTAQVAAGEQQLKTAGTKPSVKDQAAHSAAGMKQEAAQKLAPGDNAREARESLQLAGEVLQAQQAEAGKLQAALENRNKSEKSPEEGKKTAEAGRKEDSISRQTAKVVVVDLRTPEQVQQQEQQQSRVPKHLQKAAADKKDAANAADVVQQQTFVARPTDEQVFKSSLFPAKEALQKATGDEGGRYALFRAAEQPGGGKEQPVTNAGQNSLFSQRLTEVLQNEVLKNTSFIVKNGNNGEIRLVLKPESLGQIRIKLSLNNNHLEGRILVENNSIKEMLEANLKNLEQAFKEAGFESTSLDVAVGQERNNQGRETGFVPEYRATTDHAVRQFENNLGGLAEAIQAESLINMMA